jgi:hypothetical protein
VRRTLDEAGVAIKLVRTNSKALGLQSWLDSCAPQLGACLHQFSDRYGTALIGSAEPYDALWLPIGTNPILDPLLSGDRMGVVHDGAAYSRTEKVEAIAQFPFVVDRLKVCWQGPRGYENCGRCEKCLRTRLNFAAAGYDEPSCFPGSFETRSLRKLRAQTPIQIAELDNILAYVRRRKLSYPWVAALRRRILLSRIAIPIERATRWRAVRSRLRSAVKSWLAPSPQPRA